MNPKQRAAEAALSYVTSGMVVGLGTGSTADYFLRSLAAALKSDKICNIKGVPTSRQSENRALELGIPLTTLADNPSPDVTIDGADEVDPGLDLIKGLGGALLREKIVAQNSKKLVIIADGSKIVQRLGQHSPLPVEVAQFGHDIQIPFMRSLGAEPVLRKDKAGNAFISDNGNYIYDCHFHGWMSDPHGIENAFRSRAGIVGTGLFLNLAQVALIGNEIGVETRNRKQG